MVNCLRADKVNFENFSYKNYIVSSFENILDIVQMPKQQLLCVWMYV